MKPTPKEIKVCLTELHGQWYARWRSEEFLVHDDGTETRKECFESTGVPLPAATATEDEKNQAYNFANQVGIYMSELTGRNPPTADLQQTKLREFAIRAAKASTDSLKMFVAEWIVDRALEKDKRGETIKMCAVSTYVSTWHRVLENLGEHREFHPSSIDPMRLKNVVDKLDGKQERHVINVRAAFTDGIETGKVLKAHNPADALIIKTVDSEPKLAFRQMDIQRGLSYMATISDGEQWQLVTLCGIYTSMRFLTACRLRIKPDSWIRPKRSGACSMLNMSSGKWEIEHYDTKAKKWEKQLLSDIFLLWLKPHITNNKLGPGDYIFPNFARLQNAPSNRWQTIMQESGFTMVYSEDGQCRTGYHALRISLDEWLRENEIIELTKEDRAHSLRHSVPVHDGHYTSKAIDVMKDRRINAARPKFYPDGTKLSEHLLKVQEEKRVALASLDNLSHQELELQEMIQQEQRTKYANETNQNGH